MNHKLEKIISRVRNLREAAPTNSTGSGIVNYDKFLFPVDDDLLSQDFQTPAEPGSAKDEFLGVYPVMKLALNKSSDGPSIDSMVDASKEYVNLMSDENKNRKAVNPLDSIISMIRNLREEAPVNNVGGGAIAGTAPAGDDPPVRKRKKKDIPTILARGRMGGSRTRWKT